MQVEIKVEGSMFEAKGGDKVADKRTSIPYDMISETQELYEARKIILSLQNQVLSLNVKLQSIAQNLAQVLFLMISVYHLML